LNEKLGLPVKLGLLLVALAYFSFSFYEMTVSSLEDKQAASVMITDLPGALGLGFRTVGGFIAVVAVVLYLFKGHFTKAEAALSVRFVVLLEAAWWLSLLPSGYVGVASLFNYSRFGLGFFVETGLPCIVESILLPVVLVKLFCELSPNRPVKNAIKWGLIAGVSYLLVSWLNNMGNWVYTVMEKGAGYITNYPVNAFTFVTTTIGLPLLMLYAAYFSKKSFGVESLEKLNLKKIGLIITLLGLYMNVNYMLWLIFGSVGGWGTWYAWMLGHNMDQWLLALPLLGVPLLFHNNEAAEEAKNT
jgi:hypothetical protein